MAELSYRIVIGLEVHVQLLTRTKLFCGCSTQFGLPPNSATCPICIGMPGVLPVMNRAAFGLALKAALALNCQIAGFTKWDRKNYYYPDLPKNYQISQYDLPFSHDGWIEIDTPAGSRTPTGSKRVGIIRVHLEEDAGKMLHDEKGGGTDSLVDLNRAGTPLLEIAKTTAGWDNTRDVTVVQRRKEEASDYRYFPEPDLVPLRVDDAWLTRVRGEVGELPAAQRTRLQSEHGLSSYDARVITSCGRAFTAYFEDTARLSGNAKSASNWLTN